VFEGEAVIGIAAVLASSPFMAASSDVPEGSAAILEFISSHVRQTNTNRYLDFEFCPWVNESK
jgi:hypothetical protein